ncbi:MAG TPA: TonB-dependent receptor plug domain-containing protein, partial [Puia sp.]|nr:TonB-dependent receptor plug domain-containing protein [Puia sp.]
MSKKRLLPSALRRPIGLLFLALCTWGMANSQYLARNTPAPAGTTFISETPGTDQQTLPLETFMRRMQHEYGIYFSYQADSIKSTIVVFAEPDKKREPDPERFLSSVLTPAGLTYEKVNNVYVITSTAFKQSPKKKAPLPPDILVKGKVSDNNGPMTGVTVNEKGGSQATTTDAQGYFQLKVSSSRAILIFSYVGYRTMEVATNGQPTINITMVAGNSQEMSGVVVTALGITRDKRSLGYDVGQISGEDMNKVPQNNFLDNMAGKVSGVTISSTGSSPNASVSVVIRGIRSLNSDNQPLFVVDGVPMQNSMNNIGVNNGSGNDVDYGNVISDINPNDIESISILKGPSAAALYGSRAGN